MRVVLVAGLTAMALFSLTACGKPAPSSAGSAASVGPASPPPPTSSDASAGGDKYACVLAWEGKTVSCTIYSDFANEISLAGSKEACVSQTLQSQTAVVAATCPTEGLIGCCTRAGSPTSESCFYKGPMSGTAGPATCAQSAGVWSATP